MISYSKRGDCLRPIFFVGFILQITLTSCRDESTVALPVNTPIQRLRATKTLNLGIYGPQPPLVDTVVIQGKTYLSASFDSTTYEYDRQDRLIQLHLLQQSSKGSSYPGDQAMTVRNTRSTEYVYQDDKLLMRYRWSQDGEISLVDKALLDGSQRRIASRSWFAPASFTIVTDTLLKYSPEGLLISSLRIETRSGFPRQTIRQVSTVVDGNIAQTSTSFVELGQPFETTTYMYDQRQSGPLSTATLFGESSRNALLRETTVRYERSGSVRYEYTYLNEYDQQRRLVRQTRYYQPSGNAQRQIQTLTKFYYQ